MTSSAIKFILSSATAVVIENVLYYFLFSGLGTVWAQIIGRVVSSLCNFNMNYFLVFKSKGSYMKDMLKYYCLCVPQSLVAVFAVARLIDKLSVTAPTYATAIKLVIDTILFVVSFVVQKFWVFKKPKEEKDKEETV